MFHGRETRVETVVLQILGQDPDSLGTLERKRVSRFVKQRVSLAKAGRQIPPTRGFTIPHCVVYENANVR